jgi:hypothetical protein
MCGRPRRTRSRCRSTRRCTGRFDARDVLR